MLTVRPSLSALVALFFTLSVLFGAAVEGAPQRQRNRNGGNRNGGNRNNNGNGNGATELTSQERAAQIPDGISEATDGSTILDQTVTVK